MRNRLFWKVLKKVGYNEGDILPWWGMFIGSMLHPMWLFITVVFPKLSPASFVPNRAMIKIYGMYYSMQFFYTVRGKGDKPYTSIYYSPDVPDDELWMVRGVRVTSGSMSKTIRLI
jgi:hypothetical protein